MTLEGWRAWYADGTVLDSKSTAWADLPALGVQIVMLYFAERNESDGVRLRRILHGEDFIYKDIGVQDGYATTSVLPVLVPVQDLKTGVLLNDLDYQVLLDAAMASVEF